MAETDIVSQVPEEELSSGDADALPELPSRAVKDLLSHGVCRRCILRVFGIRGDPSSDSALDLFLTCHENHAIDTSSVDNQTQNVEENMEYCSLCLGILQFAYCNDKGSVVSKDSAYDFAVAVAELIKQDGHQIEEFSLEVSIPPLIQENELSVCLFIKTKYGADPWFQRKILPQCVSLKDTLKSRVTAPLEKMLDRKSTLSTLRVRLTYNHPTASTLSQNSAEGNQGCKRRKTVTATSNGVKSNDGSVKCVDFTREASVVAESSVICDHHKFPLEKVTKPCELVFQCNRTSIYFGGRYLKFSRNVSQTRWIIDDERMGDASVEELIGNKILPMCHGDSFKFHAAGREDIDVRMLGSGRPFLIEVLNARHVPGEEDVKEIERRINDSENQLVRVKHLEVMDSQGWTMMREGEAEKQKQYAALVWISRPLKDDDLQSLTSDKEIKVMQKTPIRVLHRRSPLERERIIHWMRLEKVVGSSQYFLLHLCTQAGTYIKEFVHGDLGRTNPSIGSILGCRAEILQLDVTDVKMDCFLDEQGTS